MATCYYPDGSIISSHTPCRSPLIGDGAVACCAYNDICLDNHLCLAQTGSATIARGSCTDKTWKSPNCAQYCSDVAVKSDASIFFVDVEGGFLFCCSDMDSSSKTCVISTKGSSSPFFVQAGLVIFNRTSGSTSPNTTETASDIMTVTEIAAPITITTTITATTPASVSPSMRLSSSSSLRVEVPLSAGASGLLGLALLVTLSLLWKQRKYEQSLRKDIQTWEEKYRDLIKIKTRNLTGADYQQLEARTSHEIDGQPRVPDQLGLGKTPGELDGTQIHEIADRR